jgi:hypothetical protein
MRTIGVLAFAAAVAAGCSSGGPSGGAAGGAPSAAASQRAADPRVRPLRGQAPPEFTSDVRWLNAPATPLAGLRGRAVFVQFAFPT